MFGFTPSTLIHVDPAKFQVTNAWTLREEVLDYGPNTSSPEEFTVTFKNGSSTEVMRFASNARGDLLCDLAVHLHGDKPGRAFPAVKVTRTSERQDCVLDVRPGELVMIDKRSGTAVSRFRYSRVQRIQRFTDDKSAIAVWVAGRPRKFASPRREDLLKAVQLALAKLGLGAVLSSTGITDGKYRTAMAKHGVDGAARVAEFEVIKTSARHPRGHSRRVLMTERTIIERDDSSYQVVSARPLAQVRAVVRHWSEPQRLLIEFTDGVRRDYVCSKRDEMIACLVDGARTCSVDTRLMPLSQAPSTGLRMVRRAAEVDTALEGQLLFHLDATISKATGSRGAAYDPDVLRVAQALVINTKGVGIDFGTRYGLVYGNMQGLLAQLARCVSPAAAESVPTTVLVMLLLAIARLAGSQQGQQVIIKNPTLVPSMLVCLDSEDDAVVLAALNCIHTVCRNPQRPKGQFEDLEQQAKMTMLTVRCFLSALDLARPLIACFFSCCAHSHQRFSFMSIFSLAARDPPSARQAA